MVHYEVHRNVRIASLEQLLHFSPILTSFACEVIFLRFDSRFSKAILKDSSIDARYLKSISGDSHTVLEGGGGDAFLFDIDSRVLVCHPVWDGFSTKGTVATGGESR